MAGSTELGWSTRGDDPDNPIPASTYPSLGLAQVLSCNVVPIDSPARLENHKTPLASLLATTNSPSYSIHHSSVKSYDWEQVKSHENSYTGLYVERLLNTDAATSYAIKSARYNSIVQKLKTPSAPKKALAAWKKQGKQGLPPQHMTFAKPSVKQVEGRPVLCISCTLDEAYPNFHIQCIVEHLDHSERLGDEHKVLRVAFATLQTRENAWVIALEQYGTNEASIKEVLGEVEYARLESIKSDGADQGQPLGSVTGLTRKVAIPPNGYDLSQLWCDATSFYQVEIYIPEKSLV
ncbi:hypothetical protein LIA77_06747 [Sarocladium implicatum]|nr:hypothetical protein LIA77_06747 [Sarocladium implicatum]